MSLLDDTVSVLISRFNVLFWCDAFIVVLSLSDY